MSMPVSCGAAPGARRGRHEGAGLKHIVGFSGGIDSQAVLRWARNRFPAEDIIALNALAGNNESALTVAHIKWYSENVFPIVPVPAIVADLWETEGFAETKGLDGQAELTFEELIRIKGRAPSRTRQFCTTFLKLIPSRRWMRENLAGQECERYTGVRRDESLRKGVWEHRWTTKLQRILFRAMTGITIGMREDLLSRKWFR